MSRCPSGNDPPMTNALYYGDNLTVLRDHVPDESVDLVYLDPPFNSNASYNVLFREKSGKRGADQGVDGVVYFIDGPKRAMHKAVVQVKSGKVSSPLIRDLKGTVEREKASMGLFITLEPPTSAMTTEAVSAGLYHSDLWQTDFPRIQIRTVEELLEGDGFQMPPHQPMYQPSRRIARSEGEQGRLA